MTRDGIELSYLRCGTGTTVVFLHGLAGESAEFMPTMTALAPQFHTVALDQRGHGRSTRRPADVSRESYIQDAVALIERVAPGQRVHVVGQSMGAHTAMLVAAGRPDLLASLVLLESDASSSSPQSAGDIEKFFTGWPLPFATLAAARTFLGDTPLAAAWVESLERKNDGFWPKFDADIMSSCISYVAQERWTEWSGVQAPTAVMYGEHGMFSEEQKQKFVGSRAGTVRIDLPNAGHDAHLEQFEHWIVQLEDFLTNAEKRL